MQRTCIECEKKMVQKWLEKENVCIRKSELHTEGFYDL